MKKVDFIIAGTQKGGTTALDSYLREHPDVCMGSRKEIHFFDREKYFSPCWKNLFKYYRYHRYFKHCNNKKVIGESTPSYMYYYDAPRRIWEYNRDIKIIIILRNPITRAYSHWNMNRMKHIEKLSFLDAIKEEKNRARKYLPLQDKVYSYIDRGFYTEQIKRIMRYIPEKNLLILKQYDLKSDTSNTLRRVCTFLDIGEFINIERKIVHERHYDEPMQKETYELLKNIYLYEIKSLEKLLGWDLEDWLSKKTFN